MLDWSPADQSPHTENIEIYTNAEEVELFLNDKSLGKQALHPDASPITFQVPYATGTLKAVARTAGKIVAEDTRRTAGKPTHLILTTALDPLAGSEASRSPKTSALGLSGREEMGLQPRALTPDWNDITYVTATLVDANNTPIPDTTTIVHFKTTGPASIIAVDNGNLLDHDPFHASDRKLYNGTAIAILQATASSGAITITANIEGVAPATLTLKAAPTKPPLTKRSF